MSMRTRSTFMYSVTIHAITTTLAMVGMIGCGGGPVAEPNPSDTGGVPVASPETVLFSEDGDPLVASLPFSQDTLLIQTKPGAPQGALDGAAGRSCAAVVARIDAIGVAMLTVNPARFDEAATTLADDPLIEAVQKNYRYAPSIIPDDPRFASQGYLDLVGLPAAWDQSVGDPGIVIAVLDTGVAADHPDLAGKLVGGWNMVDDSPDTDDVAGHGTAVATVAAARTDNGAGLAGVSWNSPVMPIRVTNTSGQATSFDIAAGLVWAGDHGARVANVSFAPLASDRTVQQAAGYFRSSGGLVFISAGNDGQSTPSSGSSNAVYVAAVDANGAHASFSTSGPFVDLAAPGSGITVGDRGGGYRVADGTSFASPIAAGVAALVWSVRPELRPSTVERILVTTAGDTGGFGDDQLGAGIVHAAAAMDAAESTAEVTDATPPRVAIIQPQDNAQVKGAIDVTVSADDDVELADVVLMVDGQFVAIDDLPPIDFGLETGDLSSGIHTLTCQAADAAGNIATSAPVRIVVTAEASGDTGGDCDTDAPRGVFNFPAPLADVTGQVVIQITATDNLGLAAIDWEVDGTAARAFSLSGPRDTDALLWDATNTTTGRHTITATITDVSGNTTVVELQLNKP